MVKLAFGSRKSGHPSREKGCLACEMSSLVQRMGRHSYETGDSPPLMASLLHAIVVTARRTKAHCRE